MFEGNTAATLSTSCEPTLDPIRCCGNYNRDKNPAFPRMHHKFLVFCDVDEIDYSKEGTPKPVHPTKVWTGSFNLTKNAGMSLENAVILTDPALINAYYQEWGWVLSLSEPLNWETDWLTPEFRIGT